MATARQSGSCLLLLCFILLTLGVVMLLFDAVGFLKFNRQSREFTNAATSIRSTVQGALTIVLCMFNIAIAGCGLVAFCIPHRLVTTLFLAGICLDLFGRILIGSLMLISCSHAYNITMGSMQLAIELYGHKNSTAVEFTSVLNDFAEKELCCGWAGNGSSNSLFELSAWHRQLSATDALLSERKREQAERRQVRILLPTHCCTSVQQPSDANKKYIASPNDAGYCNAIFDLNAARTAGAIHAKDCLDIIIGKMRTLLYVYIAVHGGLMIINVLAAFTAIQLLKDSVKDLGTGDGGAQGRILDDTNDDEDDVESSAGEIKEKMGGSPVAMKELPPDPDAEQEASPSKKVEGSEMTE